MSAPAIFSNDYMSWYWLEKPTEASYNNTANMRENPGHCWFVDFDGVLHDRHTLKIDGITHIFAFAKIGIPTSRDIWVEISPSKLDISDGKWVTAIPAMYEYKFSNGDVSISGWYGSTLGLSYIATNASDTVKAYYPGGSYVAKTFIPGQPLELNRELNAVEIDIYLSAFQGYWDEHTSWVEVYNFPFTDSPSTTKTAKPHRKVNALVTTREPNSGSEIGQIRLIPDVGGASGASVYTEHETGASEHALRVNDIDLYHTWIGSNKGINAHTYATNTRYIAIPTSATPVQLYKGSFSVPGVRIGRGQSFPNGEPTPDQRHSIIDFNFNYPQGFEYAVPYLGPGGHKATAIVPPLRLGYHTNYMYPCEKVCPDKDDPSKYWFMMRPVMDVGYHPSDQGQHANVVVDPPRPYAWSYFKEGDESSGFVVCEITMPTNYYEQYFGRTVYYTLNPEYGKRITLKRVPTIYNLDDSLQRVMYQRQPQDIMRYPCNYGFTWSNPISGESYNWYWTVVGHYGSNKYGTEDTYWRPTPMVYWFTPSAFADGSIRIELMDMDDNSVFHLLEGGW